MCVIWMLYTQQIWKDMSYVFGTYLCASPIFKKRNKTKTVFEKLSRQSFSGGHSKASCPGLHDKAVYLGQGWQSLWASVPSPVKWALRLSTQAPLQHKHPVIQ